MESTSTMGAASKFWKIWIFNHEAAACWRIDEVNFCTVKMRIKFSLCGKHYVVEVIFCINSGIEHRIEVESVLHPAAPAAEDTDPQKRITSKVLLTFNPLYFVHRNRSD